MKRFLLAVGAVLFLVPLAWAQNITIVTATITDVNGLPYSYASVQAQLIPPPNITPTVPPPCNGQSISPCAISSYTHATADVNGTFSMNLGSNAVLTPGGTQWQFSVNENGVPVPWGFGPQICNATLTISGASQSLTPTFAGCPPLTHTFGGGGCAVGSLLNTWVLSIHPAATCYGSADWTWDDTASHHNEQVGDGTNTISANGGLTFLQGSDLTVSSDTAGNVAEVYLAGAHTTLTQTGALSFITDAVDIGATTSINKGRIIASGGGNIFDVMCLVRACEDNGTTFRGIAATNSGNVNLIFSTGRFVQTTSDGTGSNTSSVFSMAENSTASSAAGCNDSDNFVVGESNSLACSTASTADVDASVQLGFSNSFSSTTQRMNDVFGLGQTLSATQSSGAAISNLFMIGSALTVSNCSFCYLFGHNGTTSTSNFMGFGLSATPELQITPSAVLVSPASTFTPSQTAGIVGTTTNNNVNAGSVGEFVTAALATGSSVTLTSGTTANVTSISLTAGDWDVWGVVDYTAGATTSITNERQGISTTSATLGGQDTFTSISSAAQVPTAAIDEANNAPIVRESLSVTTSVFLVANGTFTVSTLKAYGSIFARRRR